MSALKLRGWLFVPVILWSGICAMAAPVRAASAGESMIERGEYIVRIAGCNDCHTSGYLLSQGGVPKADWLKGNTFGWRGPWGTTYPRNLRLFVRDLTETEWVDTAKSLIRRPPMPWFNLNRMADDDLRAVYRFIRSLGEPGSQAPDFVPPGQEPPMPYATIPGPPPPGK